MISIEIANVTMNFPEIMKEEYDNLIEFLQDNKIKFSIIESTKDITDTFNKFIDYLDNNKLMLNNPNIFEFYQAIKEDGEC